MKISIDKLFFKADRLALAIHRLEHWGVKGVSRETCEMIAEFLREELRKTSDEITRRG